MDSQKRIRLASRLSLIAGTPILLILTGVVLFTVYVALFFRDSPAAPYQTILSLVIVLATVGTFVLFILAASNLLNYKNGLLYYR